jgi:SMODS and SLOG-associating 2TM effector domain 1
MREVRGRSTAARRDLYRSVRIGEQIDWYRSRAVAYGARSAQLFWLGVAAQLAAFGVVAVGLVVPAIARFNILGLLGTVAIAATVISQVNRHDELSKRYGFAMQELSFADTNAASAASESAFASAVVDAEGVIAREHGLWLGGR